VDEPVIHREEVKALRIGMADLVTYLREIRDHLLDDGEEEEHLGE
jgi:hypothetical protein